MNWVYMKGISIEAQYLYRRALEHIRQERYDTALKYFKQAVVIAPRYSRAYSAMAYCHANLGKYEDAIGYYNRAIEIDPANEEARIRRHMVLNLRDLKIADPQQFMGTLS